MLQNRMCRLPPGLGTLAGDFVTNGRQMREVFANRRVDLIVLDLVLPEDDGLTLCRNLRANQPYDIPILMLTARGDEANRIVGLELSLSTKLFRALRHEHQASA